MRVVAAWRAADVAFYPTPKDCRFISGNDFMALAVKAYLGASGECVPPAGESWVEDGYTWADAGWFYTRLVEQLKDRLWLAAVESGHLVPESAEPGAAAPGSDTLAAERGAGRSPAVEAHGCAALAQAVGPAPALPPEAVDSNGQARADIITTGDPLLFSPAEKELPVINSPDNLNERGGIIG